MYASHNFCEFHIEKKCYKIFAIKRDIGSCRAEILCSKLIKKKKNTRKSKNSSRHPTLVRTSRCHLNNLLHSALCWLILESAFRYGDLLIRLSANPKVPRDLRTLPKNENKIKQAKTVVKRGLVTYLGNVIQEWAKVEWAT